MTYREPGTTPLVGFPIQVRVPRPFFYWTQDPEHFVYVRLGSYAYLAMLESVQSLLPDIEKWQDKHDALDAEIESHTDWMRDNCGYRDNTDWVRFSVMVPPSFVGRHWENGTTSHSGDFYEVGSLAMQAIRDTLSHLESALESPQESLQDDWLKEWDIANASVELLDDAEHLLDAIGA